MKLKEWRQTKGISQATAADRIGWTQSTWQRIEAGAQAADANQLRAIHAFTNGKVTPNDMVLGPEAARA